MGKSARVDRATVDFGVAYDRFSQSIDAMVEILGSLRDVPMTAEMHERITYDIERWRSLEEGVRHYSEDMLDIRNMYDDMTEVDHAD